MKKQNLMPTLLMLLTLLTLTTACQKKNSDEGLAFFALIPPKAEILISDVSSDKCLNLEKFMGQIENPQFSFPAATMITDFKPISGMSSSKNQFFSFSTFYYKQSKANQLALFNEVKQPDCSSIQILSTSRELLTYQITESSDLHITFQLQNKWSETMHKKQKEALYNRIQPYEYTVIYASKNNLKIIEKYTTVDPLCESKKLLKLEITKYISWAQNENELPTRYEIEPQYYNQVKSAVLNEAQDVLPDLDLAGTLSTEEIKRIMNLPIKNELKFCN